MTPQSTQKMVSDQSLPLELVYHVIESLVPSNPHALLPPSHIATKTLLAMARVCRDTHGLATRLLRQRCVYINTKRRLADLLLCLNRFVPSLPPVLTLRNMTSLYLEPFGRKLYDQPTAIWVRELFCEISESLKRLVVLMPFQTLDPFNDHLQIRRTLREGFEQLHRLEEFVCIQDYPTLSVWDGPTDVWRLWPDLRRLTLFGTPLDSHWLWWDIATLPKLEHVILACSTNSQGTNIKDEYFHKLPPDDVRLDRDIKVVLMGGHWLRKGVNTTRWKEIDPKGRMTVEVHGVDNSDSEESRPVTKYVKKMALEGCLWDGENKRIDESD
ncbi:hypothetical protein B0T10DRAFT_112434 [Thelonectria olida]|uniref:Uncharacterized protein n=1 Tax=Thelonectria olida TaxID=1576542 RepID=A0A9P9AV53_9HYPO|nr:hypothetical protein B0T10DRAFT_112434 [Thelonectria olida]